jgi:hypothetical protein
MPLDSKTTSKAIQMLQALRDELEGSADADGAARITQAIANVVLASDEPAQPPSDSQMSELIRQMNTAPDFRSRAVARNDWIVKSARISYFGSKRLAKRGK